MNGLRFGIKKMLSGYLGSKKVKSIYYGSSKVFPSEEEVYYSFDAATDSIVFLTDDEKYIWKVRIYRNYGTETEMDITPSLNTFVRWVYILNDVLPYYRVLSETVTDKNVSLTEITTDSGQFRLDVSACKSRVDDSKIPTRGAVSCSTLFNIPYELTADEDNNDVWFIVKPTDNITIQSVAAAVSNAENSNDEIDVVNEQGILCYKATKGGTPSSQQRTIGGKTYNYIIYDLPNLSSSGKFYLAKNNTYYIRVKHTSYTSSTLNRYYYRDKQLLGTVGYSVSGISSNIYWNATDISSLTNKGTLTNESDVVSMNANEYALLSGTFSNFTNNTIYKCNTKVNYAGSTDDASTIYLETDSSKIFLYTGSDNDPFYKNHYYSCSSPFEFNDISSIGDIFKLNVDDVFRWNNATLTDSILTNGYFYKLSATTDKYIGSFLDRSDQFPELSELSEGDVFLGKSYWKSGFTGCNGCGFYIVTAKTDTTATVSKTTYFSKDTSVSSHIVSKTNNVTSSFSTIQKLDLSKAVISTDRKYEFLLSTDTASTVSEES